MFVYTDSNVLLYFGDAFRTAEMPDQLRDSLLLAPLTVLELTSQLGTGGASGALAAIQAWPRIFKRDTGVLPWVTDFLRRSVFKGDLGEDDMTPHIQEAFDVILATGDVGRLEADGREMRERMDSVKDEHASNLASVVQSWRTEGALADEHNAKVFADSIERRAGVAPGSLSTNEIISKVDAHYRFERSKIQTALASPNYNYRKHANDLFDSELLIYLAAPELCLLTADFGFQRRVYDSPQYERIHVVPPAELQDANQAVNVLTRVLRR